jgi:hypothetical protein
MMKSLIDQDALIERFASASAKQTEQLRQAVYDATMRALQGRELSLANIRKVVASVTQAASAGAAKNAVGNVESMLDQAVAGMDDAVLKAVQANRVALQQFVDRGVSLRDTQLKKALSDLEKFEDTLIGAIRKGAGSAGDPLSGAWGSVLEKLNLGGTQTGAGVSGAVDQFASQVQTAMRESRATGLKAAQTLMDGYTALVSGVLIGMSDALSQGGAGKDAAPAAKPRAGRKS